VKRLQLASLNAKAVRDALKGKDGDVVIFDGDEPLVRLVSVAAEMQRRHDYLTHYPHDPNECFYTCWRHNGADGEPAAADQAPPPVEETAVPAAV
jgi:hypothetical protein